MINGNGTIKRKWSYLLLLCVGLMIFYIGVYSKSKYGCQHHDLKNAIDPSLEIFFKLNSTKLKSNSDNNSKFMHFKDGHKHQHDTRKEYEKISDKVKILCWVMTSPENHRSKAIHVQATWGKRCDKLLFVSEQDDPLLPILKVDSGSGRDHLTAKTMLAFQEIYKKYINNYDWFLKADDDTYVIVENLKYFLSSEQPMRPVFFGHHFKVHIRQGYFSGGAGYILSKEALRRYGMRASSRCSRDGGSEDVEMGRCLDQLGVLTGDSRDALGRSRFHCFNPATHLQGGYPDWYLSYDKYGAGKGIDSISDYAISFHYLSPEEMYNMEFFIYHLRPFGIISGNQELNRPKNIRLNAHFKMNEELHITQGLSNTVGSTINYSGGLSAGFLTTLSPFKMTPSLPSLINKIRNSDERSS